MITEIRHGGEILAIILSRDFKEAGIHFLTPPSFSQQLAYMRHPAGKVIEPHVHNPVVRDTKNTLEVLFVKRGRLRVDFFAADQRYLESRILEAGDVILLASGGHGFEVLEEIEMVEVKQGPYAGDQDKTRFRARLPAQLNYGNATDRAPKSQAKRAMAAQT
jgi:mannose-6-phosphate isomerase-like protein (cupin superfamily)